MGLTVKMRNLFKVDDLKNSLPKVASRCSATLGFDTESRWDTAHFRRWRKLKPWNFEINWRAVARRLARPHPALSSRRGFVTFTDYRKY
jgi:hypothetical protein